MSGEVIAATITAIGVGFAAMASSVTAFLQYRAKKELAQVNDAVNHRHEKRGEMAPKLYDLLFENYIKTESLEVKVDEIVAWKDGYSGTAFSDAEAIDEYIHETDDRIKELEQESDRSSRRVEGLDRRTSGKQVASSPMDLPSSPDTGD